MTMKIFVSIVHKHGQLFNKVTVHFVWLFWQAEVLMMMFRWS